MTWRAAMVAAYVATVGRPRWWPVALAAFLVRGGLLVLVPAIVIVPTPAELAMLLDPSLTGAGVGSVTPALATLIASLLLTLVVVVVVTGLLGAMLDARLIEEVSVAPELPGGVPRIPVPVLRGLAARLIAHVPTVAVASIGLVVLGQATYAELLAPSGPGSLLGRIVGRAPVAVLVMVGSWLLGEAWGGLAMRRLGRGAPLVRAMLEGLIGLLRPSGLATLALGTAVVAAPIVAVWLAAGRAFERLWPLIVDGADPAPIAVALGLLVGAWASGLWLLAIGLAWRSAAWTAEALRSG